MTTTYLSGDIEADGPIPGPFSMLSFGVVAFDESGKEIGAFSRNLERLPHALQHPRTMEWWAKNQAAYDRTRVECINPLYAMEQLDEWMSKLPGKKTFVGYPASYDFMFLYWYLQAFLGQMLKNDVRVAVDYPCPFGFQALDIKTLAMIPLRLDFRAVGKRKMPREWFEGQPEHTHDPLDDARGQGMLLFKVLEAARTGLTPVIERASQEWIATLEAAIRKHRDQRGDDRCWLDDGELYATLADAPREDQLALPPREEFLANCARFHASRHPEGAPYVSDRHKIEFLRAENRQLGGRNAVLEVELEIAARGREMCQVELLNRDGLMCETHPGREWPHDDCAGPGMPWMIEGKAAVLSALDCADDLPRVRGVPASDPRQEQLREVVPGVLETAHPGLDSNDHEIKPTG